MVSRVNRYNLNDRPMITWTDALATRNFVIDGEHRALLEFLNTIGAATPEQKRRAYGKEIIQGLYRLTAEHFAHEELLMKEFAYDQAPNHTEQHTAMLASFRGMIEEFDQFGAEVIAAFVEQWIAGHLFSEDMALARFIQQNQKARKVA